MTCRASLATAEVDRRQLKRTTAPHGLTGAELKRLNGAVHLMKRRVRVEGEFWWLTTPKGSTRDEIAAVQKRITRLQVARGVYGYNATLFETRPKLHAHIVFVGTIEIAEALKRLAICRDCDIAPAPNIDELVKGYLAKERTPQAGHRRSDLGGRIGGSHRLEGGGDRVRLSRELERDAIEAGLVRPWQHTNARRSTARKQRRRQRIPSRRAPRLAGQLLLFPELSKPVARLRSFGGGHVPPSVAVEMEFRRRRIGLTQSRLGELIGLSQGHLANCIRGHDPISARLMNRLRNALLNL
jgi:hypothetical protein